jgi:putative membrane protein
MKISKLCIVAIAAMIFSIGCNTANNVGSNSGTNRSALSNTNSMTNTTGGNSNMVVANANSNTSSSGNDFLTEAASGGLAEVELGKMASSKAQNAEVKKFAQMMVTDHSKANDELKSLASKKSITLPSAPTGEHQSKIQKLEGMSGADFDKAYVDDMLEDHEKDVAEFEKQSQSNPDADVKEFASKTLPTLRKHLESIKAIHAKMK